MKTSIIASLAYMSAAFAAPVERRAVVAAQVEFSVGLIGVVANGWYETLSAITPADAVATESDWATAFNYLSGDMQSSSNAFQGQPAFPSSNDDNAVASAYVTAAGQIQALVDLTVQKAVPGTALSSNVFQDGGYPVGLPEALQTFQGAFRTWSGDIAIMFGVKGVQPSLLQQASALEQSIENAVAHALASF